MLESSQINEQAMTKHLITSALPYINGVKHLGNLIGSQLPADVYARFLRSSGHDVLFICATDEHGTPAELAASKVGKKPEEFCTEMWQVQKKIADGFALSFDHFGRSSSQQNHKLTQHFAEKLADAGLVEEVDEEQIYSFEDERYLPDRYVEGTCPNCGYENARGDQCENCTKQLDPADLINPRSAISGSTNLELRKTKHLYLKQSLMRDKLRDWLDSKRDWPILTTSIAKKWLSDGEGLRDRSITRDLSWGIPVKKGEKDWPGMEGKVFYVWFDAPIEYIAATVEWAEANGLTEADWLKWWHIDKGASDVNYTQFMAKDNIPFHTLSFPATIMGSGENWKLVDYIKGFNWLLYEGGKFSTSQGRGVFMNQALELFPADYWRYWLIANAPESNDADFTWESFQNQINKDLADVLGNFASRLTKFTRSKWGDTLPSGGNETELEKKLYENINHKLQNLTKNLNAIELRKSAADLRAMWALGNEYLQEAAPWTAFKDDENRAALIVRTGFALLELYARISQPFIPEIAGKLAQITQIDHMQWPNELKSVEANKEFTVPDNLVTKITDEERDELIVRFGGNE